MNLIIQGGDAETALLKQLARLAGASAIEQPVSGVFRLRGVKPVAC